MEGTVFLPANYIKENGLLFSDYCEVCGEGEKDFFLVDDGKARYYCCADCETVSVFTNK